MRISHFDGADVVVIDVRDPRRHLQSVDHALVEPDRAVVLLRRPDEREASPMLELGFSSPEQVPEYAILSRVTDELHWCGPVRLAWT
jgi:hypothetical protein